MIDHSININFMTLLMVMTPLFLGFLGGIWALLYRMVFVPLDKISSTLENIKQIQISEKEKLKFLEIRVTKLEGA